MGCSRFFSTLESLKEKNTPWGIIFYIFSLPNTKQNKSVQGRTLLDPRGLEHIFLVISPYDPTKVKVIVLWMPFHIL